MEEQNQVDCQCDENRCFLEENLAWIDRNNELVSFEIGLFKREELARRLEADRLRDKEEWMNYLQIQGTCQVSCRCQAEEKCKTSR